MNKFKFLSFSLSITATFAFNSFAQDTTAPKSTNAPAFARSSKQADVASATAKFGKITKTDEGYKSALDAHLLDDGMKLGGKAGAFKGTVTRVFEPRGLSILNFDPNYRSAMTAILQTSNYSKFPVLTNLVGHEVVITGTFTNYQQRPQIVLSTPDQVKLVEP